MGDVMIEVLTTEFADHKSCFLIDAGNVDFPVIILSSSPSLFSWWNLKGACGTLSIAKKLNSEGHRFVMSCAKNRLAPVWDLLSSNLKKYGDYAYTISITTSIIAIAWVCNTNNKILYMLTNIKGMLFPRILLIQIYLSILLNCFSISRSDTSCEAYKMVEDLPTPSCLHSSWCFRILLQKS